MQSIYENIGFIDADGDGKYNDLNINKTVDIMIVFNITTGSLSTTNCNSYSFIPGTSTTGWGYYKFCDQYIRFGRAYGGGGASWYHGNLSTHEIRNPMLTPAVVRTGDKATLSFLRYEHANTNFLDWQHGVSGTSTYYTDITLPAGLDFDETVLYPVVLKDINGADVYGTNGKLTMGSGHITKINAQQIRVRILPDLHVDGIYMEIAVIANGTPDPTRTFTFGNLFDYGNTGNFYLFGCHTPTVDYILTGNCSDIEMMGFSVERTSFGYTDKNKSTLISKATGANVNVIYPFDNVDLMAQMAVRDLSAISSTTVLKVSASYKSDGSGTGNAYLVKRDTPGELKFFQGGTLLHSLPISPANITLNATSAGTVYTQFIETDIAIPLRDAHISQLQAGDSISLVIYTRSTEKLPVSNDKAARPVTITLNRYGNTVCYPLIDDKAKFVRYSFNMVEKDNSDVQTSWQERTESVCADLFYGFYKMYGGDNLLAAGEYRPNVDNISSITFVYNCLIQVNKIRLLLTNPILIGNETSRTLDTNEYTVTYGAGQTTVVIDPLKDHMFTGRNSSEWVGYYLHVDWEAINMSDNFYTEKTVAFTSIEYPTSAAPVSRSYNKKIGTDHNGGVIDFYKIKVTSSSPVQIPTGSIVEWHLSIENNSAWVNANAVLPNTWIAFETPAGVTPSKLIDVTNGNTVVADITMSDEFMSYGSGYWWVKLGNVSCPSPHNYRLQCTYTVCSGTPSFAVKTGMSKMAYPQDPQNSFAQAPYNSQGMPIHAISSVNLSFTPPTVDFSGILTHRPGPTAQHITDGTNAFCDTVGFLAEFHNGLSTEVSDLKLRVTLPAGFNYDGTTAAKVKFGNGTWTTLPTTNVVQSGRYLDITLSSTNQVLSAYGTTGASAYVDFRLKISCGAENKQQIYADFIGKSGCGAQMSKIYNSTQIRIAEMPPMIVYWVEDLSVPPTPIYTNATPPTDGSFTISGNYVRAENPGESDMLAIIELPDNLELQSSNSSDLIFVQSGTRLTATLPKTDTMSHRRYFDLTLVPINPELWSEDTVKITFFAGMETIMGCNNDSCNVLDKSDALNSIKFAMQKIDIRYSDSIVACSRFGSPTAEHVEIKGWLVNDELTADFNAGELIMELCYYNGTSYLPTGATVIGLTVGSVIHDDSTQFTVVADIPYTENICSMLLVLRKTGGGLSNPYLSDSVAIVVPSPRYEIMSQPSAICQMDVDKPIGENSITGYSYSWDPSTYLSAANITPTNFTYDYQTNPVVNDTLLTYLVSIARPNNGCVSEDTVFVPLKGIPFVDANDTSVCNNSPLHIIFTDHTNTTPSNPTTFVWTVANGSSIGLPPFGTGDINVAQLTNPTTTPIIATITVTPTKNGCTGVGNVFTVTVYPQLTGGAIGTSQAFCYGGIQAAILLGITPVSGGSGNYTYLWQSSPDSNSWTSTATITQSYSVATTLSQTTFYRRIVTDAVCGTTAYSDTIQITINPLPVISINRPGLCVGLIAGLIPETGGMWTSSDPNVAVINNNRMVEALSTGQVTLTYRSSTTGCTEDLNFTVYEYPDVEEITGNKVVCVGKTIQLTNPTLGGEWTKGSDNITFDATTANPVTVTGVTEGYAYVTYTVSSGICETTRTFKVKVIPNTPPIIIIGVER
jgi:hypothetical protein